MTFTRRAVRSSRTLNKHPSTQTRSLQRDLRSSTPPPSPAVEHLQQPCFCPPPSSSSSSHLGSVARGLGGGRGEGCEGALRVATRLSVGLHRQLPH
eukprot:3358996-Rhodomonas_salina.1